MIDFYYVIDDENKWNKEGLVYVKKKKKFVINMIENFEENGCKVWLLY